MTMWIRLLRLALLCRVFSVAIGTTAEMATVTLSKASLLVFADGFMREHMAPLGVPGAALTLVQNQNVLLSKGYGLSDLSRDLAVDAQKTLFRAGSVSKLLTATAVLQLAESGRLDLEADVNDYLKKIKLEPRFNRPITAADLLLHTAGFDEVYLGMHVSDARQLLPLDTFLKNHLPSRYVPPGQFISYNDHGYTLAGLLVEDISGMPFADYVATRILKPLDMNQTTFVQPLEESLRQQLAVGYRFEDGRFRAYDLDFIQVAPAAGLIGPAGEMAHFMMALLNEGRYQDLQILAPESVAAMHRRQFAHHPALRGRSYGFSEWIENDRRGIFHDGGNPGFLARLFLLPDEKTGFYLAFNADQYSISAKFHREFTRQFLDTFFPAKREDRVRLKTTPLLQPIQDFCGYYRPLQGYSRDTLQKVASLADPLRVDSSANHLKAFGREYVHVAPFLFKTLDGTEALAFRKNSQGQITHFFKGTGAFAKVPKWKTQPVQLALIGWFFLLCTVSIVSGMNRRFLPRSLRVLFAVSGSLNIVFLVGISFSLFSIDPWRFTYGPPTMVRGLLWLPLLTSVTTSVAAVVTVAVWRRGQIGRKARVFLCLSIPTLLAFPIFLNSWNLLGFRY